MNHDSDLKLPLLQLHLNVSSISFKHKRGKVNVEVTVKEEAKVI
jgi:hypothetical protein